MAHYEFLYALSPEGPFGIPQDGVTVVPGDRQDYVGDTFDTWTGRRVSHGIQTVARWPEDRVRLSFDIDGSTVRLDDNHLWLTDETDSQEAAVGRASLIVKRFLATLSFHSGHFFQARLVQGSKDGALLPEMMRLARVTIYSLNRMAHNAQEAAHWSPALLKDRRLDIALEYFNRALYLRLSQMESQLDLPFLWGPSSLTGEAFLNYWKAITVVLGDPVQEGRRFQTFFTRINLDRGFMSSEITRLREIRNDYDVAHSIRDGSAPDLNITDEDIRLAESCAKRVIELYHAFLESQPS